MQITFDENMQPACKETIIRHLNLTDWLIPGWVQNIRCNMWDDGEAGELISIKVCYDYRGVVLHFQCSWLNETDADQTKFLMHELLHIHLSLIADYARDKINLLCPESEAQKFNASLIEELRARHESATCDLTDVIWRKLYVESQ